MASAKYVMNKNRAPPVASHTKHGSHVPNQGHPVTSHQALKPETDPFHVDSFKYVNLEKKKFDGYGLPQQQNVHQNKYKEQNYYTETETETENDSDSDYQTPNNKGPSQPVASSHTTRPGVNSSNVPSYYHTYTEKKKDVGKLIPIQNVPNKTHVNYDTETESEYDSADDEKHM